jgi:rhomboid protease GluP
VEKRRMCPNCRAFITITDRVCPYCNAQLGPRAVDTRPSQFAASFMPRANLTSIVILSLNCFFFLIELIFNMKYGGGGFTDISGAILHLLGAKYGPDIVLNHQWWRLIMAGFLHGGFLHIALNSYALFILVTETEQYYGSARLIVAYVVSTFLGFAVSTLFQPMTLSVGASAAAFGLIGTMLSLSLRRRNDPMVQLIRQRYMQWLIFSLVLSVFSRGIDIWAHAGGFAGGFLVGLLAGLPGLPGSPRESLWKALAGAAVLVVAFAILLDFVSARSLLQQS